VSKQDRAGADGDGPRVSDRDGVMAAVARDIIESAADGIIQIDRRGRVLLFNAQAEQMFGYARSEVLGKPVEILMPRRFRARHALERESFVKGPSRRPMGSGLELYGLRKDGREFPVDISVSMSASGAGAHSIAIVRDITERKRTEHVIQEAQTRLRMIYQQVPAVVWSTDRALRLQVVAGKALADEGFVAEALLGTDITDLWKSDEGDTSLRAVHELALTGVSESREIAWGKRTFQVYVEPLCSEAGDIIGVAGVALDISARVDANRRLEYQAYHDSLTGLPNRLELERLLERRLSELNGSSDELAVAFVDIDNFGMFNDTLGHIRGDQLLRTVATRLTSRLEPDDLLCRWGGDEFVLVYRARGGPDEVSKKLEFVLEVLGEDFPSDDPVNNLRVTAGISLAPRHGVNPGALLAAADAAMLWAKKYARGSYAVFDEQLLIAVKRKLLIGSALRTGLTRGDLSLVYQPIWDAQSLRVRGVEALARWRSEDLGDLAPVEFLPVAEEVGLMRAIGSSVLRRACLQANAWRKVSSQPWRLHVNVATSQLRSRAFARQVEAVLQDTETDPTLLELELTEHTLLDPGPETQASLQELRRLGVRLSIDDFGMEYSSLRYLTRLRVSSVKIDRGFVEGLPDDPASIAVTRAIIVLAHSLGLNVIGEGVETQEQLECLRSLGCDEIQGFLLSEPVLPEACLKVLLRSDWAP